MIGLSLSVSFCLPLSYGKLGLNLKVWFVVGVYGFTRACVLKLLTIMIGYGKWILYVENHCQLSQGHTEIFASV